MHRFANPARFQTLANAILPWTFGLTILGFGLGLYYALFNSPPDYQQGESVRIMYVHVPAALMAEGVYVFMAVASAIFIIWKHPLAALAAKSAAPIGLVFTGLALITGSLWGKPMWGTHVGNILGLGCQVNLGAGVAFSLPWVCRPLAGYG